MVKLIAGTRAENLSRVQGFEFPGGILGKIAGEIRRSLSITIVRSASMCLFDRLSQLGIGAAAAAKSRQDALQMEYKR